MDRRAFIGATGALPLVGLLPAIAEAAPGDASEKRLTLFLFRENQSWSESVSSETARLTYTHRELGKPITKIVAIAFTRQHPNLLWESRIQYLLPVQELNPGEQILIESNRDHLRWIHLAEEDSTSEWREWRRVLGQGSCSDRGGVVTSNHPERVAHARFT